jgi:hypothetical protein
VQYADVGEGEGNSRLFATAEHALVSPVVSPVGIDSAWYQGHGWSRWGGGEGGLLVLLPLCALGVVFLVTRGGTWRRGGREEMEGG